VTKPLGKQESLTNAKINAQQQCMYEGPQRRNLQQMNVTQCWKYIRLLTTLSLTILVYLHSF